MRVLVFWLVMAMPAYAIEEYRYDTFSTAKPTSLVSPRRAADSPATVFVFSGELRIAGKFVAAWATKPSDQLFLRFYPDAGSQEKLPYFAPNDGGGSPVAEIIISNSEQALKKLLPQDEYLKFMKKQVLEVTGETSIVISSYRSGVDCDHRWYLAQIKHAAPTRSIALAATTSRTISC